ncbi:MAG: right-handed parallel beta-helix repeat-containing protein [Clostridia bacterium]|nr:right-handed parallel beta-helix repeat-containing protein [Clostridia bacterium]
MKIYSITDFGAVADGTLQTDKIQAAIDECFKNGGGEVTVPAGEFVAAGVRLRSGVTLHLLENAVIKGTRNPEDYLGYLNDTLEPIPDEYKSQDVWVKPSQRLSYDFHTKSAARWNNGLIKAIDAHDIAIIGEKGSMINGMDCFDEIGEEHYRGPHAISLQHCKNITLKGYTIKDSANWAHNIHYSQNVSIENVTVLAGHDGAHFNSCDDIRIANCEFYTGDDCVAGFDNYNVTVDNCILNSACSAFRFGGRDVTITNCKAYGPCKYIFRGGMSKEDKRASAPSVLGNSRNNMLSFFTYYADKSLTIRKLPGNILIKDCVCENADRLIHYNLSGNETWQCSSPLESITFENFTATGIGMALNLYSSDDMPITLTMKNAKVSFREEAKEFVKAHSYKRITLDNVEIGNLSDVLVRSWGGDGELVTKNLVTDVKEANYVVPATEEFICKSI